MDEQAKAYLATLLAKERARVAHLEALLDLNPGDPIPQALLTSGGNGPPPSGG